VGLFQKQNPQYLFPYFTNPLKTLTKIVHRVHITSSEDIKYKIGLMLCVILHNYEILNTPSRLESQGGVDRGVDRWYNTGVGVK
jgi:hypothetical protein